MLTEHNGRKGVFLQADCAFMPCGSEARVPQAIDRYRDKVARGKIAVTSHYPDGLRAQDLAREVERLKARLALARTFETEVGGELVCIERLDSRWAVHAPDPEGFGSDSWLSTNGVWERHGHYDPDPYHFPTADAAFEALEKAGLEEGE